MKSRDVQIGTFRLTPARSLLLFGSMALLIGAISLLIGFTDYTDHTERADATVVERDVEVTRDSDGDKRTETTIYVSYTAEGTEFAHIELAGFGATDFHEDDTLPVAFAPGAPDHVVTPQSAEEGAYDLALYGGVAIMISGAAALAAAGMLRLHNRAG